MIEPNNKITVLNKFDNKQITFLKQIQNFSLIIAEDFGTNSHRIQLPVQAQLDSKYIEKIKAFVVAHNYNLRQILTSQIDLQTSIAITNEKTTNFINEHIENMSDQEIRKLLQTCDYLKIQSLTRIIYLYLAQKYFKPFQTEGKENKNAQSGKYLENVKHRYYEFFKLYGENLLELIDLQGKPVT